MYAAGRDAASWEQIGAATNTTADATWPPPSR